MKKVIIIGLDGFEPSIAENLIAEGKLPNLAKIKSQGSYSRLQTTYPAQTPVAWSSFATGTNPGGHGIFDFLNRNPKNYLPVLALSRYEQKNVFLPPEVVNLRRGTPFWQLLSEADIPSVIIRCPCTYPPDQIKGRMLSGVGVPDLRGGLGTGIFYSSNMSAQQKHSERLVHLSLNGSQQFKTHLIGPRHPKNRQDILNEIAIELHPEAGRILIHSDGTPTSLNVNLGEWSDWLKVKFKVGLFQSVHGTLRFFLQQIKPVFELYASQINFDPAAPLFPISSPPEYAQELESRLGTYYTLGMAEDHDGLNNGRFNEGAFLDQCNLVINERRKMMLYELDRFKEGLFFCLYDTPDRLQHMFWRFLDHDHPANQDNPDQELKSVIEEHYQHCDQIVGEARAYADDQTLFIVLSDHGMNSFKRGLNLNTWLYENGFLALKNGQKPDQAIGDFFKEVDWDKTSAYALGLAGIYLNLKDREANGIVTKDDTEFLKGSLIKGLTGLIDEAGGKQAIQGVYPREEVYSGPYLPEAPDLLVNFAPGYRVSWDTPLGGVPQGLFADNTHKWSGDHVIDPKRIPGVLFMNQAIETVDPRIIDLAPTVLSNFGLNPGPEMEGRCLLS